MAHPQKTVCQSLGRVRLATLECAGSRQQPVGVFAVVTVVAGLLIYRFIAKSGAGGRGYVVYALLRDATGLAKHSQVRIAGIPVGNIEDIRLQGDKARVDIRMNPDVPLYDDATVSKVASSLLGEYMPPSPPARRASARWRTAIRSRSSTTPRAPISCCARWRTSRRT